MGRRHVETFTAGGFWDTRLTYTAETAWHGCRQAAWWTSPLGLEGLLTNPGTPGGKDGGEANPTELHEGVQGAGG